MYWKKLIVKTKLIKYWILFGGEINTLINNNNFFFLLCANLGCFSELKKLRLLLRHIILFFFSFLKQETKMILVTAKFMYSKLLDSYNKLLHNKKIEMVRKIQYLQWWVPKWKEKKQKQLKKEEIKELIKEARKRKIKNKIGRRRLVKYLIRYKEQDRRLCYKNKLHLYYPKSKYDLKTFQNIFWEKRVSKLKRKKKKNTESLK